MIDTDGLLHDARKRLVLAAEAVMKEPDKGPDKSQFNHLAALCNEAACAEEIENFLRYQCSRDRAPWERSFAERVIEHIKAPLTELEEALRGHDPGVVDGVKVKAWRLYAVYLTRAYTYRLRVQKNSAKSGRGRR